MAAIWNMIDDSLPQNESREYQTTCVGKRRRISKVSISLHDAVADRLRHDLRRKNSVVELDTEENTNTTTTSTVTSETAEATESAASRVLENFDLFETIMLQLPWAGHSTGTQRQTIRTIMTTSLTCRNFQTMINTSARLQKRLFLSQDPSRLRPCHCGSPHEYLHCCTETNPFLTPLLQKHILHNSFSCDHRRHKQTTTHLSRAHQISIQRRHSRAGPLPETHATTDIVFKDLQSQDRKHVLAFQVSENDPFYLLGERSAPHAGWRNTYFTNPAPTRVEIYYWSYLIRVEAKDGGLTAGEVWDVVRETLEVARLRKAPGYQLEGDEPLLVMLGAWVGEGKHVFDWLKQRYQSCAKVGCRYLKT